MRQQRIRVVIVDDHPGVRKGIKNLLKKDKRIAIVGEASDGKEAIQIVLSQKPDILLLDIELPILKGDEVVKHINAAQPEVRVMAVSSFNDRGYVQGMLDRGAMGYITKDEAPEMLLSAIHKIVEEDSTWVSPSAAKQLSDIRAYEPTLTQREIEIFKLLLRDRSERDIAQTLEITEQRLEKYIQILMSKFDAKDPAELIRIARKLNVGTSK